MGPRVRRQGDDRVARNESDALVTRKHHATRFGKVRCYSARLTIADWVKVEDVVIAAGFWLLDDSSILSLGTLDGASWRIAGRRGRDYHSVRRQSPHGTLRDLGRLMFDLAGLHEIRL
jgi:hypothetical protein